MYMFTPFLSIEQKENEGEYGKKQQDIGYSCIVGGRNCDAL
jgi:hypothetical protein